MAGDIWPALILLSMTRTGSIDPPIAATIAQILSLAAVSNMTVAGGISIKAAPTPASNEPPRTTPNATKKSNPALDRNSFKLKTPYTLRKYSYHYISLYGRVHMEYDKMIGIKLACSRGSDFDEHRNGK